MSIFRRAGQTENTAEKKIEKQASPARKMSEPVIIKRKHQEHNTQPAQQQKSRN